MKKFKLYKQPFCNRLKSPPPSTVQFKENVLIFNSIYVRNLAKASGLRSNKKRAIKKRFKCIINQTFQEAINENKR